MKKSQKNQKKTNWWSRRSNGQKWTIILALVAITAAIIVIFAALCSPDKQSQQKTGGNPQVPVQAPVELRPDNQNMGNAMTPEQVKEEVITGFSDVTLVSPSEMEHDLTLSRVGTYTGKFVEDGSNREVTDVLAILVTNDGDRFVEYAEIFLLGDDRVAQFTLTSLPAGQSVLVMEKSGLCYDGTMQFNEAVVQTCSKPDKEFSLYPEIFSIKAADGVVNLINNSQKELAGPIAIYYKNVQDGIYIGGVTYGKTLENSINAGGIAQFMAESYTVAGSELVFIRYAG